MKNDKFDKTVTAIYENYNFYRRDLIALKRTHPFMQETIEVMLDACEVLKDLKGGGLDGEQ